MNTINNNRIASIDVLRAIVLLGILIVHTINFQRITPTHTICEYTNLENWIFLFSDLFLAKRCAKIFCILFGISFYIISHKESYSAKKFVARSLILIGFGLFNKLFYTYDALMWYGISALFLIPIRNCSNKILLLLTVLFYSLSIFLSRFHLGEILLPNIVDARYTSDLTMLEIIKYQPLSVLNYLKIALNGGLTSTYSRFLLGYLIASIGLYKLINIKYRHVLIAIATFAFIYILQVLLKETYIFYYYYKYIFTLAMSLTYVVIFFYIYNLLAKVGVNRFIDFLSYYGRMGLTNYSVQGIVLVLFYHYSSTSFMTSFICMMVFYII